MSVKTEEVEQDEKIEDDVSEYVIVSESPKEEDDMMAALKAKMAAKKAAEEEILADHLQEKSEEQPEEEETEEMPPKILAKKTRTINFGVVGSGQAGSRLAESLYKLGYSAVAFNTATQDLEHIQMPEDNKIHLNYGLGGASKDPNIGAAAAEAHKDLINQVISEKLGDAQMYVFCTSLGGGSGGGSIETIIDVMSSHGKPILVLTVLPMTNEDPHTKKNAIDALAKLAKEVQSKHIHNLIVVDNAKIETIFSDVSQMDFYRVSNAAIVEPLDIFNTYSSKPSNVKSLDPMEWSRILIDGGGLSLYGCMTVENYEEDTAIAEAIIENLNGGLLAEGFDLKQTKYVGAMVLANKKVWAKIPSSSINYAMAMIQDVADGPDGVFRGVYEADIEEDVVKVYSFFSGLALPDSRVQELKTEVKGLLATIKDKDTKRDLNLSIDTGETKATGAAAELKERIAKKKSMFGQFTRNVVDRRKK